MRGRPPRNSSSALQLLTAMLVSMSLFACSTRTEHAVTVLAPPASLMEQVDEPDDAGQVLELLRKKRYGDAATAYTCYVLNVRDAFQIVNGKMRALRDWSAAVVESSDE